MLAGPEPETLKWSLTPLIDSTYSPAAKRVAASWIDISSGIVSDSTVVSGCSGS